MAAVYVHTAIDESTDPTTLSQAVLVVRSATAAQMAASSAIEASPVADLTDSTECESVMGSEAPSTAVCTFTAGIYTVSEFELNVATGFNVTAQCAEGYEPSGTGPEATTKISVATAA